MLRRLYRCGVQKKKNCRGKRGKTKMKKKLVVLLLAATMSLSVVACGGEKEEANKTEAPKTEAAKKEKTEETKEPKVEVTYQTILDDYSKRIADATPGLVEEYNVESAAIANDITALAELSNTKVSKLAEISNQGVTEMATLMQKNGDEYSVYEEWANKLMEVYTQYSAQITDAYTASTSGMSAEDMLNSLETLGQ